MTLRVRRLQSTHSSGPVFQNANLPPCPGLRAREIEGARSGGVTHALRALQRLTVEGHRLRRYEAELARGHLFVDVAVHGRQKRDKVVQILRSHGAHFINAYGQWTIESVAA
jgi:hypothetical protein